jgi:hypothetical protein
MFRSLQELPLKNKIVLLVTLFLLILVGVIVRGSSELRSPRPQAANQTKIFGPENSTRALVWEKPSYPPDPGGACSPFNDWVTVGSYFSTSSKYQTYRSYLSFNTASIPDDVTVTSAKLRLTLYAQVTENDFILYIRDSNWPNKKGLKCDDDYGGNPPTRTLLSSYYNTANLPGSYNTFDVTFSNLSKISKTGSTNIMLTSNREESNTNNPASGEFFVAETPRLFVTYKPPPAPTVNIKANNSDGPITISYNSSATLSWTSTSASSCAASGAWSGSKSGSGSTSTGNLTSAKTYTLTCSNSTGSASDSVTVNVSDPPPPPPPPPDDNGGTKPPSNGKDSGGSGTTPLPPPPTSIPGLSSGIDPNIVNSIKLNVSIPYLLDKIKIPAIIGKFSKEIEVSPGINEYEIDVRGAKFKLGDTLSIQVGGNKTLLRKVRIKTKAPKQKVKIGSLFLGDLTGDNRIGEDDATSFIELLKNASEKGEINGDGAVNSLDWAIIYVNFGKIGDR